MEGNPSWRDWIGRIVRMMAVASVLALCACRQIDHQLQCGRYHRYVDNAQARAEVLAWADASVFEKPVESLWLGWGGLVGPGRREIRLADGSARPPRGLATAEVRLVAQDAQGVSAIFIGEHAYRGILVMREDMQGKLGSLPFPVTMLENPRGRVAVMCYLQR